jgi:hypothetical protein
MLYQLECSTEVTTIFIRPMLVRVLSALKLQALSEVVSYHTEHEWAIVLTRWPDVNIWKAARQEGLARKSLYLKNSYNVQYLSIMLTD